MSIVYLNGDFMQLEEAKVSVLDRGFTFSDGVYEVMPAYNRKIFCLPEHLQRLARSLEAIFIKNPYTNQEWQDLLYELIERNEQADQYLYLQITRGVTGRDHIFDEDLTPTIFVMSKPLPERGFEKGINAITHEDIRWKYCDIKSIALIASVLLRHDAKQKGAIECILIKDGYVTEGAASNVFLVEGDRVVTSEKDRNILHGITRDLVIKLLSDNDIAYSEEPIAAARLHNADEIWITSSTWEVVPVIKLDDKKIGQGVPGSFYHEINELYQAYKLNYSHGNL